jgi:crotonobetaine/carnitine-CoA ligase
MNTANDISILAHLVARGCEQWPNEPLLTFVDERSGSVEKRALKQVYDNASCLAAWMIDRGMQPGDRFGVLLLNHPELVEALVAASISGCVAVPIDPRTRGDKLSFMLNDSSCKGIVCADYNVQEVATAGADSALEWSLVLADAQSALPATLAEPSLYASVLMIPAPAVEVRSASGSDPLQILYTSGTTGDPKGIIKPNAQFTQVGLALPTIVGLTREDRLYSGLSLTHGNAQFFTLAVTLGSGIPSVFSRRFTRSRMWDTVRQHGCTMFTLLGGMTTAIFSVPQQPDDADNPVRLVLSAGMPAAIWRAFEKRFDLRLFEVYGAAEGGLFWNDGSGPVGSFGHLHRNPLHLARVIDTDEEDCLPGEVGELIWRNRDEAPVSVQYLGNPEASQAKTAGGWFRTGDMVHCDAEGWLFFDYRKGGGIRHNGDFINPGFVEKALAEHPDIADVFVYGVPGSSGVPGEKDVVAAIVVSDRETFSAASVFKSCRRQLESNFVPSYLQIVDEIPKTASEKPQERFLLEQFSPQAEGIYLEQDFKG